MFIFTIPIDQSPKRARQQKVEEMYAKYADTIYRIAFVRTLSESDSEDILQEVFLRYIRSAPDFADGEHERAWFIRVAVNCSSTLLSSAWRRRTSLGEEPPQGICDRLERDSEVYHAVMQLEPNQRTAVHLYYYEDCSVRQIAKLTGSSESAVKSRLMRAREALRSLLKEDIDV